MLSLVSISHLSEMVDASSGINLWREWAKMETAEARGEGYKLPPVRKDYSGIIISLTKQEYPDLSPFSDPEIVWRMDEPYHIGLVVRAKSRERVMELLDNYAGIIQKKYHASAPAQKKPTH